MARRPSPHGPGWEVLVKWRELGYEAVTWESEGEGLAAGKKFTHLLEDLWERQSRAAYCSSHEALAAEAELRPTSDTIPELEEQPEWVGPGRLHPHQVTAVNWLRAHWAAGHCGVLADEPGLGRSAAVVVFLQEQGDSSIFFVVIKICASRCLCLSW